MKADNIVSLPEGRKLAYSEFGEPEGYPVFYFHAAPSSRLEPLFLGDELFSQFGLHVICPDRPGIGLSDFQPGRGFSDWPKDIVFLADALGLEKFSVLGISGGSGYAAVCAARIPEKLSKVVIASGPWRIDAEAVSSIGFPMNLMWRVARNAPIFLPFILRMMTKLISGPPKDGSKQGSAPPNNILPPADHAVMAQPGKLAINQQVLSESLKGGSRGPVWDMRLYVREWDFDPAEIRNPLTLFHGGLDKNFPVTLVRRVANSLPHAQLITYPEDGHISTYVNHFDDIAEALLPD